MNTMDPIDNVPFKFRVAMLPMDPIFNVPFKSGVATLQKTEPDDIRLLISGISKFSETSAIPFRNLLRQCEIDQQVSNKSIGKQHQISSFSTVEKLIYGQPFWKCLMCGCNAQFLIQQYCGACLKMLQWKPQKNVRKKRLNKKKKKLN